MSLKIYIYIYGSPRTCHEFSTSVRSLSHVDIAWLVGLQYGSLCTCLSSPSHSINAGSGIEPLTSCVDDVGGVGLDKLDKEEVVDKPGTFIAICFTCSRRRKSACWRSSWQVFPNMFEVILVRISLISVKTVLMCNDFLLCWLVETRLIPQEDLLELLLELGWRLVKDGVLRTWFLPINFNCPSAVLGIIPNLGEIISFALSFMLWNSDASIFVHLLKVCQKSSFPNFSNAYQTYSRSVSGNTVLTNWKNFSKLNAALEWYSFQRTK